MSEAASVTYSDQEAAQALVGYLPEVRWEAIALAYGYLKVIRGLPVDDAAHDTYQRGYATVRKSRELLAQAHQLGFRGLLSKREKTGSAENPIPKLFPATVTEQRFLELSDALCASGRGIECADEREVGHGLSDFTLRSVDDQVELPINIKTAGTAFLRAAELVGIEPSDCFPIPAYKAHAAIEKAPDLLYVISVDYGLGAVLGDLLPKLFTREESIVWDLITNFGGARIRQAEDAFVFGFVRRHWSELRAAIAHPAFRAISARKAIKILQSSPKRTPGIGLRAWGTGASAEVNVHISLQDDTKPWEEIVRRVGEGGLASVVSAINRRRTELVYDPEI